MLWHRLPVPLPDPNRQTTVLDTEVRPCRWNREQSERDHRNRKVANVRCDQRCDQHPLRGRQRWSSHGHQPLERRCNRADTSAGCRCGRGKPDDQHDFCDVGTVCQLRTRHRVDTQRGNQHRHRVGQGRPGPGWDHGQPNHWPGLCRKLGRWNRLRDRGVTRRARSGKHGRQRRSAPGPPS